jgi:hypothetical protein
MIEEILKANKISQAEYDLYQLFQVNELGRKCLDRMMQDSFMDEPQEKEFSGIGFAFYDGRRSVLRDIHRTILKVEYQIKEALNDRPKDDPTGRGD